MKSLRCRAYLVCSGLYTMGKLMEHGTSGPITRIWIKTTAEALRAKELPEGAAGVLRTTSRFLLL